jgi:DNA-binding response OmpR family regulator
VTRLLLVEDEEAMARTLCRGLREESYVVDHASDGDEALWAARTALHDAMILDVRIPRLDGREVCRRLRAEGSRLPILMLTACDAIEDVVHGLDAGADDYLTKPFAFAELLARLRALVRRGSAGTSARLTVADLELDTSARKVCRAAVPIEVTEMEFRVLELLMRNAGSVQTRARLAAALWDDEIGPGSNALEVHVANLRRKIDAAPHPRLLHTRRGVGYVLTPPEEW